MNIEPGRADDAETLIFINYRGSDAASAAALLHAELSNRFGPEAVFLDYESIPLGRNFTDVLLERVRRSAVLLVVVGDRWLDGKVGARQIDDDDDWVRREIIEAFEHDVPIVPILVGGARLNADRLPAELRFLATFQYFEVRARRQRMDIRGLGDCLIRQIPKLRDRPVQGMNPMQALVAALQDGVGPGSGSNAVLTVEVNQSGNVDQVILRRPEPSEVDRGIIHDQQLFRDMVSAAGLRDDALAASSVREWMAQRAVADGRHLQRETIEQAVAELGLRDSPPRAVLSVATLKPDLMAARADHALDWVDRFEGNSAYLKRRPLAPATWAQLQADIEAIPGFLPDRRSEVLVTGSLRQASAFAIGGALRMVTGPDVAINQRNQLWTSRQPFDAPATPRSMAYDLGAGSDLAVAIAVAADPTADVLAFLKDEGQPVDQLVVLSPAAGIRDNAIPDAAAAAAFAHGVRDTVRAACNQSPRVHLFLAGPVGVALLLGHRWNRLRPTIVYEDVRAKTVYEEAFRVDA